MDMIMVDVSRLHGVSREDTVTLIGKDGREEILVDEWSQWAETNPYEVFCNISDRVDRVFTTV
jgi:alanine racemase